MAHHCLIVEDHHLLAEALELVLARAMPDLQFVHAATLGEARAAIRAHKPFDFILLDLCLPDSDGFMGLLELRGLSPSSSIVISSAFFSRDLMQTAIIFGASAYIPKTSDRNSVIRLVQQCRAGAIAMPEGYDLNMESERLTFQQLRVLELVSQGFLNKQIAHKFGVCETTIKAHVSEILRKLGVASRTQAVLKVVEACSSSAWDRRQAMIAVDSSTVERSREPADLGERRD